MNVVCHCTRYCDK